MGDPQIGGKKASLWEPVQDRLTIGLFGKLGEESNELGGRICRSLIQGLDGIDPESGRTNLHEIEDEIADVLALIDELKVRYALNTERIEDRRHRKFVFHQPWFDYLTTPKTGNENVSR